MAPIPICFYPDLPGRSSKLRKHQKRLGLTFQNSSQLAQCRGFFFWKYSAHHEPDPVLENLIRKAAAAGIPAYNLGAVDVRKHMLDRYFSKNFGLSAILSTDHLFEGRGLAVEKGDGQCTKDARLLTLPIEGMESGKVYMRFIDSRRPHVADGSISKGDLLNVDIRIPYFRGEIPFLIRKWKDAIFKRGNWRGELLPDPLREMSRDELANTVSMMQAMRIDYAELDAVRDSDGNLYIIDCNPTPGTMGGDWNDQTRRQWLSLYVAFFREAFLASE